MVDSFRLRLKVPDCNKIEFEPAGAMMTALGVVKITTQFQGEHAASHRIVATMLQRMLESPFLKLKERFRYSAAGERERRLLEMEPAQPVVP